MHESFSLGRIAGMRIGANWSLVVVVWLIAWSLADSELPAAVPGQDPVAYWGVGVTASVVFFACLLAHELSHSLVARRHGIEVDGIVLWLFGGVSRLRTDPATADAELKMAVAGPATSAVIAVAFLGLSRVVDSTLDQPLTAAGLRWLGWINGILAAFNLVPAFPLDGGRVLRAWLWRRHGDKIRATMVAARAGRVFAFTLIGLGMVEFAAGGSLGGLWLVFLGWFLLTASTAEATRAFVDSRLAGLPVRVAMTSNPVVVPAGITVGQLIEGWMYRHRCSTFPLVGPEGAVVGLVTLARVKQIPAERRELVLVSEVACPASEIVTCDPEEPLTAVIARMNASADQRALVYDGAALVGIVSPSDVTRSLEHAELVPSRPPDGSPRSPDDEGSFVPGPPPATGETMTT